MCRASTREFSDPRTSGNDLRQAVNRHPVHFWTLGYLELGRSHCINSLEKPEIPLLNELFTRKVLKPHRILS
jgi:hypothetical protein